MRVCTHLLKQGRQGVWQASVDLQDTTVQEAVVELGHLVWQLPKDRWCMFRQIRLSLPRGIDAQVACGCHHTKAQVKRFFMGEGSLVFLYVGFVLM